MFKLKGIKLGVALLLLSGTVGASVIIDNQLIPTEDIVSISITPGTGTLIINTVVPYDVVPSDGTTPPVGSAAITSFAATSYSFDEGGSTTLSWSTQDADSCQAVNGTPSWRSQNINLPSGSSSSIQINTAGSYQFSLVCTGADNATVTRNLTVTVNAAEVTPPTNPSCNSPALSGDEDTWTNIMNAVFPNPTSATKEDYRSIPSRGYRAYHFNTGNAISSGKIVTVGATYTSGFRIGTISECPGDFQVSNECKHSWGIGGGIDWATNGMAGACQLQPNTDYYLNITFTDGVDPGTASCTGSSCRIKIQHVTHR